MGDALAIAAEVTDAEFLAICRRFPDTRVEVSSSGEIIVLPPTDPDSGYRTHVVSSELYNWNLTHGRGRTGDAATSFRFPDGSRRCPDTCWYDLTRWNEAKRGTTSRYPVFAPEFVVEVSAPTDSIKNLQRKMEDYMDNGVQLGWLIDPKRRTVMIYRPNRAPELLLNPTEVLGDGPVEGFVLKTSTIFE
jgi:Uma2 family endonuclease